MLLQATRLSCRLVRCHSLLPGTSTVENAVLQASTSTVGRECGQRANTRFGVCWKLVRGFAGLDDHQETISDINELFAEARLQIEDAKEDANTVYFNESASEAKDAAGEVLRRWRELLEALPPRDADSLQRSMGLKMEQLKAELQQLDELHD